MENIEKTTDLDENTHLSPTLNILVDLTQAPPPPHTYTVELSV